MEFQRAKNCSKKKEEISILVIQRQSGLMDYYCTWLIIKAWRRQKWRQVLLLSFQPQPILSFKLELEKGSARLYLYLYILGFDR